MGDNLSSLYWYRKDRLPLAKIVKERRWVQDGYVEIKITVTNYKLLFQTHKPQINDSSYQFAVFHSYLRNRQLTPFPYQ